MKKSFEKIVEEFNMIEEVESIMLSGSAGSGMEDGYSDYDLYIYSTKPISVEKRRGIIEKYSSYTEMNNQFWETEDNFILADENRLCEIIYRDFGFIEGTVGSVIEKQCAWVGYTTCFWHNLINSTLLFDRSGKGAEYIKRFSVDYPEALVQNIIDKNFPILRERVSSYFNQIKKAVSRDDFISINHRVAAFLASYFDIIFALNKMGHPGEKKLIKIVSEKCNYIPENFRTDMEKVVNTGGTELLEVLNSIVDNLENLIKERGYKI